MIKKDSIRQEMLNKTALVLEGGGFRGVFTAGVLEVLLENNLLFPYAVGVSAGSTYGVSYASQQIGRNLKVNSYISDKRYSSIGNLLKSGSLFSWDFILDEIPNNIIPFDFKAFENSITQFWVEITNCNTGEGEYININSAPKSVFKTVLAASCSLPLIAPMVSYKNSFYLDGGLSESIPFKHAFTDGNEKAVVILTRPKGYIKKPVKHSWLFKWYYHKYPKVVELLLSRAERYNQSIEKLEELEKQGKLFILRPETNIEVSRLENNAAKTEAAYYQAMDYANKQIDQLRQWLN